MKTNFTKRLLGNWRNAVMALAMITAFGVVEANAQGSCYVCTDGNNVSLQAGCEVIITPDLLLADGIFARCNAVEMYLLTVSPTTDVSGNGTNSVTIKLPGTYTYTITGTNNKCWGTFNVEDEAAPLCIVPNGDPDTDADYIDDDDVSQEKGSPEDDLAAEKIDCSEDPELYFDVLEIDDFEDCTSIQSVYSTTESVFACSDAYPNPDGLQANWDVLGVPRDYVNNVDHIFADFDESANDFYISAIHKRTWYAKDDANRTSVGCSQYVFEYRSTDAPELPDLTGIVPFDCDVEDEVIAAAIAPTIPKFIDGAAPGTTVLTNGEKVCNYIATLIEGEEIPHCGNGYKQVNRWQIIDWCSRATVPLPDNGSQLLVVEDQTDPEEPVAGTVAFVANPFDCNGNVVAGAATSIDICSGTNLRWTTSFEITGIAGKKVFDTNGGELKGVEMGAEVTVTWTAYDECDNYDSISEIFDDTDDNRAPIAICNDKLNISLVGTHEGQQARAYAEDLDDTSKDNCAIASKLVSLDGENYSDYVTFTCDDIGEQTVYLKVTDAAGNFNVCWTIVNVEDKTVARVAAPDDVVITCIEELPAVVKPTIISGGCTLPTIEYLGETTGESQNCYEDLTATPPILDIQGTRIRSWKVTHPLNNAHSSKSPDTVYQVITILSDDFTWTMEFPEDVLLTCDPDNPVNIPDELEVSDFLFASEGCEDWQRSVEEKYYYGVDGTSCYKIVRTYVFANWCAIQRRQGDITDPPIIITEADLTFFDEDDDDETDDRMISDDHVSTIVNPTGGFYTIGEYGIIQFTRFIKVRDASNPTVSLTAVPDCDSNTTTCNGGSISGTVTADDNCSDATITDVSLTDAFGVEVDIDNNLDGADYEFTELAAGTYTVSVVVVDACGNVGVATETVTVIGDCKAPTPVGVAIFSALMESDLVDLWMSDIENNSSYDNCTSYEDLTFAIELLDDTNSDGEFTSADASPTMPTDQSVTITCDKIEGAMAALWVMDEAGNTGIAIVPIVVTDNDGTCADPDVAASIEGRIVNENDIDIDEVMVKFEGPSISPFEQLFSGVFNYSVPMHSDIKITPEKDLGYMNGLSTADLVKLQRHILGISYLTSAYQLIAADATNDNAVDTRDMLHVSRLILGIYDELPSSKSWRFVAKSHVFADPTSPWGFPEAVDYADLSSDVQSDFIGIKIADLTGNAKPSNILGDDNEPKIGELNIAIDDVVIEAGTNHTINFTAKDFNDFAGYQFTIALNDKVSMTDLEVGALPNMTEANFGLNRLAQGVVTTSWANADAISLEDGAVLFSLTVKATETVRLSEVLNINSEVTAAEAYNNSLEEYGVQAQFNRIANNGFELFQNQPNPFNGETLIGFNMPEAGEATLKVMNVAGQVLSTQTASYTKGYNQIKLNKSDLNATGVLYYQIETEGNSATKKMIILE